MMSAGKRRKFFDIKYCKRERRWHLVWACLLFWSIISYFLISRFLLQSTEIIGPSMVPTLQPGDRLVINRWVYRWQRPQRGDIVAVRTPQYEDLSVKRVIALPHERIQLARGRVHVNGRVLDERYLLPHEGTYAPLMSTNVHIVADNCYFLLGDNRAVSIDSRTFGAVPRDWVVGRLLTGSPPVSEARGLRWTIDRFLLVIRNRRS
jgi:signal peptidase I